MQSQSVVTTGAREATVYTTTHPHPMGQWPKHDVFGKRRSFGRQIAYSGYPVSDIRIQVRKVRNKGSNNVTR